ncbi:glycoside hydrolase [Sphaerosporella brunnea]|uniref:Mannan endo-1,6-alpha-mannosidase n=1 Tax=Sphaerosporella brunnea TaxID=1250544 RepID=A0A5J5EI68_9PEZI|nr:glycoside hydrolase [Sphaerosporella brunnea]
MKFSTLSLLSLATAAAAIDINVDDQASIKAAASDVAKKLRALYPTGESWFVAGEFGKLPPPPSGKDIGYYWWEGGAAMGAWIDYWAITGDDTYNDIVTTAMLSNVGPENDYQPPRVFASLGNDDQAFWGIAAMSAAERGFPDPPKDKPQWLALAQAVFNRQASRWDTEHCGGGLRWQVMQANNGYNYKNSISNGLFFQIGARLARYTGNTTYVEWAEKVWDWTKHSGLLTSDFKIYDGFSIQDCVVSGQGKIMWSYNAGTYLAGAAYMYDYYTLTGNPANASDWKNITQSLLQATDEPFFNRNDGLPNIMRESGCESQPPNFSNAATCNTDQRSFKAYLSRFFAYTYQLCPFTRDFIMTRLRASAVAAAKSCTGSPGGDTCGLSWLMQKYDGSTYGIAQGGVGEHLAAMELFQNLLIQQVKTPNTQQTGTSKGNPSAGSGDSALTAADLRQTGPTTAGDRAGASILTIVCICLLGAFTWFLVVD